MSVTVEILFYNDRRQDGRVKRNIEGSVSDHIIVITKDNLVENLRMRTIGSSDKGNYLFEPLDKDSYIEIGSEFLGGTLGGRDVALAPLGRSGQTKMERDLSLIIEKFVRGLKTDSEQIVIGVNMEGANTHEAFAVCNVSSYIPMLVFNGKTGSDVFPTIPRYVPLNTEQLDVLKQFHYTFLEDVSKPILTSSDITENTGKSKRNVDRALEFLRENGLVEKTEAERVRKSAGKTPACYKITDDGRTMLLINLRARGILPYFEDPKNEIGSMVRHEKIKKDI